MPKLRGRGFCDLCLERIVRYSLVTQRKDKSKKKKAAGSVVIAFSDIRMLEERQVSTYDFLMKLIYPRDHVKQIISILHPTANFYRRATFFFRIWLNILTSQRNFHKILPKLLQVELTLPIITVDGRSVTRIPSNSNSNFLVMEVFFLPPCPGT